MARHKPTLAGSSQRCGAASSPRGDAVDVVTPRRSTGDRRPALRRHRDRKRSGRRDAGARLAPTGKRICSSSAATTSRVSATTGTPARCSCAASTARRSTGSTSTATSSRPSELLRRREHEVLRRGAVPVAARGLRRDPPPRRHVAGVADGLRRLRAVVHPGREPVSRARPARGGPDRGPASAQYPSRGAARATDPAAQRRPREAGLHPSHLPIGVTSTRTSGATRPTPAGASAATASTGSRACSNAKSDAQVDLCRSGAGAPQRRADDQRPRGAAGDRRERPHGQPVVTALDDGSTTVSQRGHRRGVLRCGQLRPAAAAFGERRAPEGARQQLRRGGSPLHAAQQPGAHGRVERAEPHPFPEDARRQRLVLGLG